MTKAKQKLADRHCNVDRDWDYSMCERGRGPAEVEEDS